MAKRVHHDFFIYKTSPFRPLYRGNVGFRQPPTRVEQSASRKGIKLWLFRDRSIADLMAKTNDAEVAMLTHYAQAEHGHPFHTKPQPRLPIEDLI